MMAVSNAGRRRDGRADLRGAGRFRVGTGEGAEVLLGGLAVHFKLRAEQTGGQLSITETTLDPHRLVPPHIHAGEDEYTYVAAGTIGVRVAGEEFQAAQGCYAGYLAGYHGLTREAYTLDPRQFTTWCRSRSLSLFSVRRADIESFARQLEANGRARATVTRRLSTIAGFYKYAVEEELLDHSPAAHVRRPRVDYESHAVALDRNELGALLVAAGLGSPVEHALISLLALNGLRVSEATGADIEHRARSAGTGR
jgi:quercetin dioxygenase-like cupin family protein